MTERRLVAALAAAALLLVGCSGGTSSEQGPSGTPSPSSTTSTTPTTPPVPPVASEAPRPDDDACYRLGFDQALAPTATTTSVPCRQSHTAETYEVGTVANLADGHLLAIDSAQVQRQVATVCPAALADAVGGSPDDVRLSMLRSVWFTPTVEDSDDGADWYRCDVVALGGADRLLRVEGSLRGVLATPEGRDTYGMCGTAGPDDERFERVPCSRPHAWRAFSVVDLPAGDYPGRAAVADAGSAPCQDAAAASADDPLDYEWGFEGPDPDQWAAGQTFVRCWAPV